MSEAEYGIWGTLPGSITVVIVITALVVWFSASNINTDGKWYQSLTKPPGVLPDYGFAIVWGIFYLLLPIATIYALAIAKRGCDREWITALFITIMMLTAAWILAFSMLESLVGGFIVLVMTLIFVGIFIYYLGWISSTNGAKRSMKFPIISFCIFFVWLLIATYYNFGLLALNYGSQ